MQWHIQPLEEVFTQTQSRKEGLKHEEAQEKLAQHGRNELISKPPRPIWLMFLGQFKDVMIIRLW
jgi:Ca2+-transporting ATPase